MTKTQTHGEGGEELSSESPHWFRILISGNQGLLVGERRLADSLALEHRVKQRRVFLSCFCSLNDI